MAIYRQVNLTDILWCVQQEIYFLMCKDNKNVRLYIAQTLKRE